MTQTTTVVTLEMRKKLMIAGRPSTVAEYNQIMNAKPNPINRQATPPTTPPFRLMR